VRKGEVAWTTTLTIIIILAAFILLLPFVIDIARASYGYAQGGACMASAGISSIQKEKFCLDYVNSPVKLNCDRRHVIIGEKEAVVVQGNKEKVLKVYSPENERYFAGYNTLDGEVADSIVAEELRTCWKQFSKGESVLLNQAKINRALVRDTRDETACFICSDVSFTQEDPLNLAGSDMSTYIREKNIPKKELTYYDYLNNPQTICENFIKNGGTCWQRLERYYTTPYKEWRDGEFNSDYINDLKKGGFENGRAEPMGPLKQEETYLVMFIRKRFDSCQGDKQTPGDAELSNFAYVINAKEVGTMCDAVVS